MGSVCKIAVTMGVFLMLSLFFYFASNFQPISYHSYVVTDSTPTPTSSLWGTTEFKDFIYDVSINVPINATSFSEPIYMRTLCEEHYNYVNMTYSEAYDWKNHYGSKWEGYMSTSSGLSSTLMVYGGDCFMCNITTTTNGYVLSPTHFWGNCPLRFYNPSDCAVRFYLEFVGYWRVFIDFDPIGPSS